MTGASQDSVVMFYSSDLDYVFHRTDTEARIEGAVLRRVLRDWLPGGRLAIADIGGGNGRWAFDLAAAGHDVRLADVTPELVAEVQRRNESATVPLTEAVVASGENLPWNGAIADAALLLGPMYCTHESDRRMVILREARRVLTPGGVLFAQYFNRVAGLRSLLFWAHRASLDIDWRGYLRTGAFSDPQLPAFYREVHYWHSPDELRAELQSAGFAVQSVYGMDGPAPEAQELLTDAPERLIEQWAEIATALSADQRNLAASNHLLAVATVC